MAIDTTRKQFPFLSCDPVPVYLDNAATTQKPQGVIDATIEFYTYYNGNPGRGNHTFARRASDVYDQARESVAKFIFTASSEEIVFTRNTTESINLLAHSLAEKHIQAGDVILLSQMEHHSNLLPWIKIAQTQNARLEYLPVNQNGEIEYQTKLDELRGQPIRILALTHVSNVFGTINPVRKIVESVKQIYPGVISIVDAAQAIAHTPVNIDHLQCDFLAFSAHKIYGPTGIGILYGRKELLRTLNPFLVGGGMVLESGWDHFIPRRIPARFEAGTQNVAGAYGLSKALEFIGKIGFEEIRSHERNLTHYLLTQLDQLNIAGLKIYGRKPDQNITTHSSEHIGLVSLNIDKVAAHDLANYLDDDHIMVRAGRHCTYPLHQDVLKTNSTLRISFAIYNTRQEIDLFLDSLQRALKLLR